MSGEDDKKLAQPLGSHPVMDHYPPPPPGPPPSQQQQQQPHPAQHTNETAIPDYNIPAYDPNHPTFAPPPPSEDIYGADPILPQSQQHSAHTEQEQQAHYGGEGEAAQGAAKPGWGAKFAGWGMKAAMPFNAMANKMGSETFLPTAMDKECEKAARILRSFCSKRNSLQQDDIHDR